MKLIDAATDLLEDGEPAVAILTDGRELRIEAGTSCCWKVNRSRIKNAKKVILFYRPEGSSKAEIYLADFDRVEESKHPGRRAVHFTNPNKVGESFKTWMEFANTGQCAIRYFGI